MNNFFSYLRLLLLATSGMLLLCIIFAMNPELADGTLSGKICWFHFTSLLLAGGVLLMEFTTKKSRFIFSLPDASLGHLFGIGGSSAISRALGERHKDRACHISSFCCYGSLGLGVIVAILSVLGMETILHLIGASVNTIGFARQYLAIIAIGAPFIMFSTAFANILRGEGASRESMVGNLIGTVVNIILDPIMILVLGWGVTGAALATIMSQLLSAVLVMITLIRTKESYRFIPKELRVEPVLLKRIIKIGLPAGLQSMMYSISNILIQANINGYGTNTIASWAVYGKIDGIFWMTMDAMGISVTTFAGQNFGAGKIRRLKKGTYVGLLMSTIITAALGLFMFTAGSVLISLFTNDVDVMAESMNILCFLVPFWFCYICVNVYPCTLRGVGDALIPMLIICVGTCILRVIWVFGAGAVHPGLYTTLTSYPLSWSITSLAFLVYYYRFSAMRKLNKLIEE